MMPDRTLTRRAQEMFTIIERFLQSGLPQKAFCKSEDIALSTFQWWLSQYRKQKSTNQPSLPIQSPAFITVKPQASRPAYSPTTILTYPNGVTLRLTGTIEPALLKELINLSLS
jgi:hypothetical protein